MKGYSIPLTAQSKSSRTLPVLKNSGDLSALQHITQAKILEYLLASSRLAEQVAMDVIAAQNKLLSKLAPTSGHVVER